MPQRRNRAERRSEAGEIRSLRNDILSDRTKIGIFIFKSRLSNYLAKENESSTPPPGHDASTAEAASPLQNRERRAR